MLVGLALFVDTVKLPPIGERMIYKWCHQSTTKSGERWQSVKRSALNKK